MPYLLYGIMRSPVVSHDLLAGLRGSAVSYVEAPGLSAAVSALPVAEHAPPVAELLAYGRALEELHRRQPVVPMRYGCFLDGVPAVERLLAEREHEFGALLAELAGRVEMGIRILLPNGPAEPPPAAPATTGGQFLAGRRAYYRIREEASRQHQALRDRFLQALTGLYATHRTETATRGGLTVLSLYFLVPQGDTARFREAFRRLTEEPGPKALLSGPWPPYNFATAGPLPGAGPGLDGQPRRETPDE